MEERGDACSEEETQEEGLNREGRIASSPPAGGSSQ
jgi:hypothetical protein